VNTRFDGGEWGRSLGVLAVVVVVLSLVLLAVFLHIVPLARERTEVASQEAGPRVSSGVPPTVGSPDDALFTAPPGLTPQPGTIPTTDVPTTAVRTYQDADHGFRLDVPADWETATVAQVGPLYAADYDVVFAAPGSPARIAVSAWSTTGRAPFGLWLPLAAGGMLAVDGRFPTNAVVAGRPAAIVWSPESAADAAYYAAFLEDGGRHYWRVAYGAGDGGEAITDFLRALVTLEWGSEPTLDTIPPLPAPTSRYHPRERLFGTP
jgi:hypothetical protein